MRVRGRTASRLAELSELLEYHSLRLVKAVVRNERHGERRASRLERFWRQRPKHALRPPAMDSTAQGVLAFVQQVAVLQKRLDQGEAAAAASAQSLEALDGELATAEDALTQAREQLAKRGAETAKFASKVADYEAVLVRRAAGPTPLEASRAERAQRLASLRAKVAEQHAEFMQRCARFQAANDPGALSAAMTAGLSRVQALTRQAEDSMREVLCLRDMARQATEANAAAAGYRQRLATSCAGALLPAAWPRLFVPQPLTRPSAALRDSIAAETRTCATLTEELAALAATPAATAAAAASAAAAESREEAYALADACAAQRMELSALRDECARADAFTRGQRDELAHLEARLRNSSPHVGLGGGASTSGVRSVTRALSYDPTARTLTLSTVQTDTRVAPGGGGGGGATPLFITATSVQQQQRVLAPQQAPQQAAQRAPPLQLMPAPPSALPAPAPIFDASYDPEAGPQAGGSSAKRRRKREPLVIDDDDHHAVPPPQQPAPAQMAATSSAAKAASGAAKAPAAAARVKTAYGGAKKPAPAAKQVMLPQARDADPWGGRSYGGA